MPRIAAPSKVFQLRRNVLTRSPGLKSIEIVCCLSPDILPVALRAKIISLGLWVSRYTDEAMWTDLDLGPLVDVNTAIMKGLLGNPPVGS